MSDGRSGLGLLPAPRGSLSEEPRDWMTKAALPLFPRSQLISVKACRSRGRNVPCALPWWGRHGSMGREWAHSLCPRRACPQAPGLPVSSAGRREREQTLGAARGRGCWGGGSSLKGTGWSCDLPPPGPKASSVHPNAGIGPSSPTAAWPLPMARPDVPTGSSKLTVLSHRHTFAHVKLPSPQLPLLKAKSTWKAGAEAGPQPAPAGPADPRSFTWPGSAQLLREGAQSWRRGQASRSARLPGWGKGSPGVSTIDISSAALLAEVMAIGTW